MRRLLRAGFILGQFALATPALAQDVGIEATRLADGVHMFRTTFDGYVRGNSVAIINENDVVVIDTHTRPSVARAIIGEIRKLTDKPVRLVVNTHWHPDHWSGNEVFEELYPGVQFIATEETVKYMRAVAPAWPKTIPGFVQRGRAAVDSMARTGRNAQGEPVSAEDIAALDARTKIREAMVAELVKVRRTFPTMTYRDRMRLARDTRDIELISMTGDASGSTVVYLPVEKIIIMGDLLVFPGQWGSNGYALAPWLEDLRRIQQMDVRIIVPGHGPAFDDKQYLGLVIDLFDSVIRQVNAALENGLYTNEQVAAAVDLSDLRARFEAMGAEFDDATLITMAYREARDGLVSR